MRGRNHQISGKVVLGLLYLLLSHSQIIVRAQQVTLKNIPTDPNAASLASALTGAFAAAGGANATLASRNAPSVTSSDGLGDSLGLGLLKSYQSLLDAAAGNTGALGGISAASVNRAQVALTALKNAYSTLSSTMGSNVAEASLRQVIGLEQLLLKTVGTALGELTLVVTLLAIASFIMVTVGGALYTAGSAVLLDAQINGLKAAQEAERKVAADNANNGSDTRSYPTEWYESSWFTDAAAQLDAASGDMLSWSLSGPSNNALTFVDGIMQTVDDLLLQPPAEQAATSPQPGASPAP